jgi:hypothetical protein
MSITSAPVATAKPAPPTVLSLLRRHIAAIVLVMIFAAGLGLALSLALSPLDLGHLGLSDIPSGVWTR